MTDIRNKGSSGAGSDGEFNSGNMTSKKIGDGKREDPKDGQLPSEEKLESNSEDGKSPIPDE